MWPDNIPDLRQGGHWLAGQLMKQSFCSHVAMFDDLYALLLSAYELSSLPPKKHARNSQLNWLYHTPYFTREIGRNSTRSKTSTIPEFLRQLYKRHACNVSELQASHAGLTTRPCIILWILPFLAQWLGLQHLCLPNVYIGMRAWQIKITPIKNIPLMSNLGRENSWSWRNVQNYNLLLPFCNTDKVLLGISLNSLILISQSKQLNDLKLTRVI